METAGPRVLVCTQGFPRHPGDHHAPFVLDHARALAGAGASVTVVCPSAPGLPASDRFGDVEVIRFRYAPRRLETLAYGGAMHHRVRGPHALLLPFFLIGFLVAVIRRARTVDVLHAHWWAPSGLVAVVAGRLTGVATTVQVHGTDAAIAKGPLRILARRVLRSAGAVVAASADLAAWVRDVSGVEAVIAPMPLATDRVPAPTPPPADGPVLAVGRLVPEKGFDVLIDAAASAGVAVTIAGDGPERAALEARARSAGASVTLLGSVPPAELADRYRAARLVAVPSRREGFGLVAAEACAAGRAVVASAVGGLPDVISDGRNGVLVTPGDVDELARALVETDPALGAAGPASVEWLAPAAIAAKNLAAHEHARQRVRPALGPRLVRWGGALFAVLALVLCVRAIADSWNEARSLDVRWQVGPVVAAVAAVVVADLVMAWSWGWLVRRLGGHLPWREAMRVWWVGQLGRYLPTGLGSVPARVVVGGRRGVPRRLLLRTSGAEVAVVVAVCAAFAALLLSTVAAAVLFPLGLVLTAVALGLALRGRVAPFVAHQAVQVAVRALGFWAVLHVVAHDDVPALVTTAGAVGLAYFLGFVAVFSPGGIGVREAVLAGALAGSTGPAAVAAAAVVWRLLELGVELPLIGWARGLVRDVRPEPATGAPKG